MSKHEEVEGVSDYSPITYEMSDHSPIGYGVLCHSDSLGSRGGNFDDDWLHIESSNDSGLS